MNDGIDGKVDFKHISLNLRRGTYKFIGMGSGRVVFDMGNGYVVKAARNRKGIAQNQAEYKIAQADHTGLFAKIPGVSERYTLLVMAKADRIKSISFVWKYFNVRSNFELYQVEKLQEVYSRYDLMPKDLGRHVNWGQIDGKPVIIDYGFTREVRRNYYLPPLLRILGR